jgi:hypothetical protein
MSTVPLRAKKEKLKKEKNTTFMTLSEREVA